MKLAETNSEKRDTMGQKNCKKLNIEIPPKLHNEIKQQAKERNITIRTFVLRCILPVVIKNRELRT